MRLPILTKKLYVLIETELKLMPDVNNIAWSLEQCRTFFPIKKKINNSVVIKNMVIKIFQQEPTSQIFFSSGALHKINYKNNKNDA